MKRLRTIIIGEVILCVLNFYTAFFLAHESIKPFGDFIYDKMYLIYDTFLNTNGGMSNNMMTHYTSLLLFSILVFFVLLFIYIRLLRKKKISAQIFSSFVLSIVPFPFFLIFVFNFINLGSARKYVYWVLILFFVTNIAFSIQRCFAVKELKNE